MSRREIRVALTIAPLLLAGGLSQIMTYNRLTPLAWALTCAALAGALLAELIGYLTHREWMAWLGPACALLCLGMALLFTFAPPQPESGPLVDTSSAWERYQSARTHSQDQNQ
jgi:peptidoglycan/LPS O-acetylase OafA/YrhL